MAFLLDAQSIRNPQSIEETNSTQYAQQKTLNGDVGRDYFGDNKRVWSLAYRNVKKTEYDTIKAIYDSYLTNGTAKTWEITETNYTVSSTSVHIDLRVRNFTVRGSSYISDFDLILTEA
jgi:hypothetical protein